MIEKNLSNSKVKYQTKPRIRAHVSQFIERSLTFEKMV
jgi:hypothetical protein